MTTKEREVEQIRRRWAREKAEVQKIRDQWAQEQAELARLRHEWDLNEKLSRVQHFHW